MTYTLDVELDEPLEHAIEDILSQIEGAIEDLSRFRPAHAAHEVDVDIDELLAKHHAVAVDWDIHDVQEQRSDLSDEQAWEVLRQCRQDQYCLDRLHDAMRETILDTAKKLHPKREARPNKAGEAIAGYADGDERENLIDLITDAMHWCEAFGEPFDEFYATAKIHFDAETKPSTKGE